MCSFQLQDFQVLVFFSSSFPFYEAKRLPSFGRCFFSSPKGSPHREHGFFFSQKGSPHREYGFFFYVKKAPLVVIMLEKYSKSTGADLGIHDFGYLCEGQLRDTRACVDLSSSSYWKICPSHICASRMLNVAQLPLPVKRA